MKGQETEEEEEEEEEQEPDYINLSALRNQVRTLSKKGGGMNVKFNNFG